ASRVPYTTLFRSKIHFTRQGVGLNPDPYFWIVYFFITELLGDKLLIRLKFGFFFLFDLVVFAIFYSVVCVVFVFYRSTFHRSIAGLAAILILSNVLLILLAIFFFVCVFCI